MPAWVDAHLLTLIVFAPVASVLALLALQAVAALLAAPRPSAGLWRLTALVVSLGVMLASWHLARGYDPADPDYQFVERVPWLAEWGLHYFVGIDGISLVLVLLTTFLVPIVCIAAWNDAAFEWRSFSFFVLVLESAVLGAFASLNLVLFYGFWQIAFVPMAFLIGVWGGAARVASAVKFLMFTTLGSLPLLLAALVVASLAREAGAGLTFDLVGGVVGSVGLLDVPLPVADAVWWKNQTWLFAAFTLGFAIVLPVVPLHAWMPDAQVEAPTAGSVLLAGVLLKLGAYGLLRYALPLFPAAAIELAPLFLALGVTGIVYAALLAWVQTDVKRLVAYASLAQLGFVTLGVFALDTISLDGAVLQLVNHGLSTGALFLLVGMLIERRSTREMAAFGGVARPMPVFAAFLGLAAASSMGVPGLNGFVSELLVLVGTFLVSPTLASVAAAGGIGVAAALLWMLRRVLLGPIEIPENRGLIDLGVREKCVMIAVLLPVVAIGVYPEPWLRRIEPSVVELLRIVEARIPLAEEGEERWAVLPPEAR